VATRCYASVCITASAITRSYTHSLHDALPISASHARGGFAGSGRGSCGLGSPPPEGVERSRPCPRRACPWTARRTARSLGPGARSEEHTAELQSRENLVCRLLLEKKKKRTSQS